MSVDSTKKVHDKISAFFTIAFDMVVLGDVLPYDIYINSSAHETRNRFVKIVASGTAISPQQLLQFKKKFNQFYILESQRGEFLQSLPRIQSVSLENKVNIIKDSAINHLDNLFSAENADSRILGDTIKGCKDSVESIVGMVKDCKMSTIKALVGDLSFHDFYTYDHSVSVSIYGIAIYKEIYPNADKKMLVTVGIGGMLHDIGKIKIPTSIINNPDKLSYHQMELIRQHPDYGLQMLLQEYSLEQQDIDLELVRRIVAEHHENYNGSGYPKGLKGEQIHLLARIISIADFFDALTTKRSYHKVHSTPDALAIMQNSVGKKIDPQLFAQFKNSIGSLADKEGNYKLSLEEDFDPCQPQNQLPLQQAPPKIEIKDFGKMN